MKQCNCVRCICVMYVCTYTHAVGLNLASYRFHVSSNWEWDWSIVKGTIVDVSPSREEVDNTSKGPQAPNPDQPSRVELLKALLNTKERLQNAGRKNPFGLYTLCFPCLTKPPHTSSHMTTSNKPSSPPLQVRCFIITTTWHTI